MKDAVSITGAAHMDRIHDSAAKHVTGTADYTDDIAMPEGTLHAYLGVSDVAHAKLLGIDYTDVLATPGVVGVLTADDVPGVNDISPTGLNDEPVFPTESIQFHGQPLFAVIAETRDIARRAAELARIDYEIQPHALDPIAAQEAGYGYVTAPLKLEGAMLTRYWTPPPIGSRGEWRLAGRITCTLKGISPLPFRVRTMMSSCTVPPSIRLRRSTWLPVSWACPRMRLS